MVRGGDETHGSTDSCRRGMNTPACAADGKLFCRERVESRRALARWKRDRNLDEESFITTDLGDETSKAEAVEYGKQLREQFYQSIFSDNGLDLNMACYNVGGGSASDAATDIRSCARRGCARHLEGRPDRLRHVRRRRHHQAG